MAMWTIVFGVVYAVAWGAPTRWGSYRWSEETIQRITVPALPTQEPAVAFLHPSWNERLSSRLQGAGGMRQDSVITALRRSTNCELHRYTLARVARAAGAPDIEPPPSSPGAALRTAPGEPFGNGCIREINADRYGTVALAPLIWQGDLPGIEEGRPMFVRDFGPELNRRLLEAYPERQPFVFVPKDPNRPPEIVPYAEAMAQLLGVVRPGARP